MAISYSVPMNCYILMTYLLFILVVLSVPAVAGGSISLEREKKTLDVLLTTNLNPWRIITGKLEASLGVVMIHCRCCPLLWCSAVSALADCF